MIKVDFHKLARAQEERRKEQARIRKAIERIQACKPFMRNQEEKHGEQRR